MRINGRKLLLAPHIAHHRARHPRILLHILLRARAAHLHGVQLDLHVHEPRLPVTRRDVLGIDPHARRALLGGERLVERTCQGPERRERGRTRLWRDARDGSCGGCVPRRVLWERRAEHAAGLEDAEGLGERRGRVGHEEDGEGGEDVCEAAVGEVQFLR